MFTKGHEKTVPFVKDAILALLSDGRALTPRQMQKEDPRLKSRSVYHGLAMLSEEGIIASKPNLKDMRVQQYYLVRK